MLPLSFFYIRPVQVSVIYVSLHTTLYSSLFHSVKLITTSVIIIMRSDSFNSMKATRVMRHPEGGTTEGSRSFAALRMT